MKKMIKNIKCNINIQWLLFLQKKYYWTFNRLRFFAHLTPAQPLSEFCSSCAWSVFRASVDFIVNHLLFECSLRSFGAVALYYKVLLNYRTRL